jgi:DNA polymerase
MNLQPRAKIWIIAPMQKPDLDFVIAALKKIRETSDRPPRASRSALTQLQLRAAVAASLPAAPKLREGGREALERHAPPVMPKPMAKAGSSPKNYLGADSAAPSKEDKSALLVPIRERVRVCTKCPHLVSSRTQTVFGVGNPNAELMFVGEAPGFDEDRQGEPFVGRAGQLLTRIIKAMGFAREDVYIANVLKCRPDMPKGAYGNRTPTPQEMQTCRPYLVEQIDIIQPKVVVALGAVAVEGLLGTRGTMRELRGRWHSYNGVPLMITYHPAYLLRNQAPSEKRKVWEDMLQVLERLEKPISEKQRSYFV